jgi:TIR domain
LREEDRAVTIGDDAFRVFISHKQEDHALAVEVKRAVEGLDPELIHCFVSGVDIAAGVDWRREIRSVLAESHLLVLLFTAPTKNWDWCLYETGLFTRFDLADPRSVVCLSAAGQGSPSPLADL